VRAFYHCDNLLVCLLVSVCLSVCNLIDRRGLFYLARNLIGLLFLTTVRL